MGGWSFVRDGNGWKVVDVQFFFRLAYLWHHALLNLHCAIMLSLWTRAVFTACEFPGTAILFQWPALKLQMGHKTHNNHYPFGGIWEWKDLKISGQTDCAEQNEWWVLWFRDILYSSGDRNVIKLHTASISENLLEIIKRRKDYLLSVNQT